VGPARPWDCLPPLRVYICIDTHTHTHTLTHKLTHTHTHTRTQTHTDTHTLTHTRSHTHTHFFFQVREERSGAATQCPGGVRCRPCLLSLWGGGSIPSVHSACVLVEPIHRNSASERYVYVPRHCFLPVQQRHTATSDG